MIVVSAMYKLTPMHPFDPMKLNEYLSPQTILTLEEGDNPDNLEAIVVYLQQATARYRGLQQDLTRGLSPYTLTLACSS